jgi:hypothetical protein
MKRIHGVLFSMAILAMAGVVQAAFLKDAGTDPATVDRRLTETVIVVNTEAASRGDAEIAAMLSGVLGVDAAALLAQRSELGVTWGDLMVATEMSQISGVTIDRILDLRSEGMTWKQIMTTQPIPAARVWEETRRDLTGWEVGSTTAQGGAERRGGEIVDEDLDGESGGGDLTDREGGTNGEVRTNGERRTNGASRAGLGIDRKLEREVQRLEAEAGRRGDAALADRLASELEVSSDLLLEQRAAFDADWGDLLIAYTIAEQSRGTVTIGQVFEMRSDGMTWFQIARSLRIPPGRLMRLIRSGTSELIETTIARSSSRRSDAKTLKEGRTTKKSPSAVRSASGGAKAALSSKVKGAGSTKVTAAGATKVKAGGAATMKAAGPAGRAIGGTTAATMRPTTRMGGAAGASAMRVHGAAGRGHGRR